MTDTNHSSKSAEAQAERDRLCKAAWRARNPNYRSPTAKPRSFYKERWLATAAPEEVAQKRADDKARARSWKLANPELIKARSAAAHAANRDQSNARRKAHYEANRGAHQATNKAWVEANKERNIAYKAAYYEANRDRLIQKARDWNRANPGHLSERRASEPTFAILCRLRTRLQKALLAQGVVRSRSTKALIGCSPDEFRLHIEGQFTDGMGWSNRSHWHLDHKIPCAYFDLSDPIQQAACFHFSNIQPLWSKANRQKGAKILPELFSLIPKKAA